jgi:putative transposase
MRSGLTRPSTCDARLSSIALPRVPTAAYRDIEYPFHDRTITVTRCGRICMGPLKINLSQAFASQRVGVKQVEDKIWLVSFMRYDLGFFDHETCRIESAANPFSAKLLPMSPV